MLLFAKSRGLMHAASLLFVLALLTVGTAQAQNADGSLFMAANHALDERAAERHVVRSRAVTVDLPQLTAQADRRFGAPDGLTLNLFEDAIIDADVLRTEPRPSGEPGYVWVGRVVGDPLSTVHLVITPDMLYGTVEGPVGNYEITTRNNRSYTISQVDLSVNAHLFANDGIIPTNPNGTPIKPPAADGAAPDSGDFVDVMFVYTASAEGYVGGAAQFTALADGIIAYTNTGYADSGINHRLRMAGTYKTNFVEQANGTHSDYLYKLTYEAGSSDDPTGIMDDVFPVRDNLGADIVALLVNTDPYSHGSCGNGWKPSPPDENSHIYGYSTSSIRCSVNRTVSHEIGHNFGASHDIDNAWTGGASDYSYGYRVPGVFRTTMAYASGCNPSCPGVNRWSNPNMTYQGLATGTAYANNARALNETAYAVANYRATLGTVLPVTLRSPRSTASAASTNYLYWDLRTGVDAVQVDVYDPTGAQVYSNLVPASECSEGWYGNLSCSIALSGDKILGTYSVYMQSRDGNLFGDWTLSQFTMVPGNAYLSKPWNRQVVNPSDSIEMAVSLGREAYFVVADVYYPNGGWARHVIEKPDCAYGNYCEFNIPTYGLWGEYQVWMVSGWGQYFSNWNRGQFYVQPDLISLNTPTGTISMTDTLDLTFDLPEPAYYAVADIYYPNGGYDRRVIERPACPNDTCTISVPSYGLAGNYSVWIIPGLGDQFGSWELSEFTLGAAGLASAEVDVLGSAAEAAPPLDTSAVEAAVEGPGS